MARAKLGDMLAGLTTNEPTPSPKATPSAAPPADAATGLTGEGEGHTAAPARPAEPRTAPVRAAQRRGSRSEQAGQPYYQTLERKEARLRADQYRDLTECARTLNRARRGEGERITENTLIRVAVDLLLARTVRGELHGITEDELRKSVGL